MVTTGAMPVGERRCGWLQCWLEVAALRAGISYLVCREFDNTYLSGVREQRE